MNFNQAEGWGKPENEQWKMELHIKNSTCCFSQSTLVCVLSFHKLVRYHVESFLKEIN